MTQLSVLHLSTSDVDSGGARAAYRLHQGLQSLGVSSQMLVRAKFSSDCTVIPEKSILTKLGPPLSNIPLKLYSRRPPAMFSVQWSPDVLSSRVGKLNPEVIHLHWVCNGFLQIETLAKFNRPLVWTLHDMWPFTGGCHYAENCIRYTEACGACPQLGSDRPRDLSHWVFQRKNRAWKKLNITIVSPSQWLANCARKSTLFQELPIKIIPHGVDLTKYKPVNQHLAREILNLPPTKKIILFGASPGTTGHSRKGSQFLQPALQKLSQSDWQSEWELAILGTSEPENSVNCGFKVSYLGSFRDDTSLALVYSAVDVVVVPSVQEAFGQIASEALACGTPVVAFAATGLKDIVDHQQNGYLAQPFDADDLAKGIAWVLEDEMRHQQLRLGARTKAEQEFDVRVQASRYLPIYGEKL